MRCLPIEGLYAIHFSAAGFPVPTLIFSPLSFGSTCGIMMAPCRLGKGGTLIQPWCLLATTDEHTNTNPVDSGTIEISYGAERKGLCCSCGKPPCFRNFLECDCKYSSVRFNSYREHFFTQAQTWQHRFPSCFRLLYPSHLHTCVSSYTTHML